MERLTKDELQKQIDFREIEKIYDHMKSNNSWGSVVLQFENGELSRIKQEITVLKTVKIRI
jgi:hypothetical protein